MNITRGPLTTNYSSRGNVTYQVELTHAGLHRHRIIKGPDASFVERKVALQIEEWNEQWEKRASSARRHATMQQNQELAEHRSAEADEILNSLRATLESSLDREHAVNWDALKSSAQFAEPAPRRPDPPAAPIRAGVPREPLQSDVAYEPLLSLLDKLVPSRAEKKRHEAQQQFRNDHRRWSEERDRIQRQNLEAAQVHTKGLAENEAKHNASLEAWEQRKKIFLSQQEETNQAVDRQREAYLSGSEKAIEEYCDLALANSRYPDFMPKEWELDYVPETKVLVVDYALPAPEALPALSEVKYVTSRAEFVEKHLPESQQLKLYDDVLYQVVLRTLYELFSADAIDAIAMITFNGYVRSIDRATGKPINPCVLSVSASKAEFAQINLRLVDPKACFKALKGVGSSKLHSMAAVAPIMNIRREDGRFIAAHDVAYQLDDSYNLAAMDWEEFEQLIRELFEKEFAVNGGEVKVTQASRDGGVDAVAFDPDPIRGGKIVIQAKRYTNTVGVAAVRDLYGTLMNEGATKGILVTTSDYGPDAYAFARNKPLTLLNGSNLLHLLEKHGHRAQIDLEAARAIALQQRLGEEPN